MAKQHHKIEDLDETVVEKIDEDMTVSYVLKPSWLMTALRKQNPLPLGRVLKGPSEPIKDNATRTWGLREYLFLTFVLVSLGFLVWFFKKQPPHSSVLQKSFFENSFLQDES